jgi:hypothetical protein
LIFGGNKTGSTRHEISAATRSRLVAAICRFPRDFADSVLPKADQVT